MDLFKKLKQSDSAGSSRRRLGDRVGWGSRSRSRSVADESIASQSQTGSSSVHTQPSSSYSATLHPPHACTSPGSLLAPGPDIDTVWTEALKIACGKLGDNNLPTYLTSLTSQLPGGNIRAVIEALVNLQKAEKDKRLHYTWNGKKVVIVERLGKFLKTAEKYSPIVGTAMQSKPEVAALVWACVWATMRVCIHLLCQCTGTILIL